MRNMKVLTLLMGLIASPCAFSQAHLHGQGTLLVSQEGNEWQLNLTVPAEDALGFEHSATTPDQIRAVRNLAKRLESDSALFQFEGTCKRTTMTHSLFDILSDNVDHTSLVEEETSASHDEQSDSHHAATTHGHEHEHDHNHEHEHEHEHEHDIKSEHAHDQEHHHHNASDTAATSHEHRNVEVQSGFHCESSVSRLRVMAFDAMPSLDRIEAQWIIDNGQGAKMLTSNQPFIEW